MTEFMTANVLSWIINYFIHSTLFIGALLLALKLKWVSYDRCGEWLLKSALVLGAVTALIQTSGVFNNHQLYSPILRKTIFFESNPNSVNKTDILNKVLAAKPAEYKGQNTPSKPNISPITSLTTSQKNDRNESLVSENALIMIWFSMVAFFLVKLLLQKRSISLLLINRKTIADLSIQDSFNELKNLGQFKQSISLSQSKKITTPIALSNEVVLPASFMDAPKEQVEAAIAHELAHIKRHDYHWLNFSHWFHVLTFFQPLNQLINQQIHQLAELSADDLAARWTKNPKALATALFSVAEKNTLTQTQMVPAMTSKKSKLLERIENIINQPNRNTKPVWIIGFIGLLALVIFTAPGVIAQTHVSVYQSQNGEEKVHKLSHDIVFDGGKTNMNASYSDDDRTIRLKAKLNGEMRFSDDESRIVNFPTSSKFDVLEDNDGFERRILIKSDRKGETKYTYYEDGDEIPYDSKAQLWFAQIIPEVMRTTGLNAEARVKRIQSVGGDTAVLDEIELINSDFVRKTYFKHLFNISKLGDDDLTDALALASEINSDFELSNVLSLAIETQDIETENQWSKYMKATQTIQSDFEMSKTMLNALEYLPQSNDINEAYFNGASSIQSDFELAKVLKAYIEKQPANSINMVNMFELATTIQSDFELANVLKSVNSQLGGDENAIEAYLKLATTIQSDFEMKNVYSNLLQYDLSSDLLRKIVDSAANDIASDFELASLLEEIARNENTNESVKDQIIAAAKENIGSSFERERVFSAAL